MKKYLYSALALPLLFACSSDDLIEKEMISNDQFAGIEKVDATFIMDEGALTRFDGKDASGVAAWKAQQGDLWGFAWLGDGTVVKNTDGFANQNHNLIQKDGFFQPQTSIYVGKYYIYRPYDETTVSPQAINFKSLVNQPLAEGYESTKQPWKDLAKTAINIGDKWTDIVTTGHTYGTDPTVWDLPGIGKPYKIYAALFSNQTGLDLTYLKNNPKFAADAAISGATDISFTCTAGSEVGAADIYQATVQLAGATNAFTYAPVGDAKEPITVAGAADHSGTFWADKKNVAADYGFTFDSEAPITLIPADAENGLSTGAEGAKAWFWFNSLPKIDGDATLATTVTPVFETSYGTVTINTENTLAQVAQVFDKYDGTGSNEWMKLNDTGDDNTKTPKEWDITAHNTFVNQYGNHKGKYVFTVDFSKGVMTDMHIKNDAHLQKLLKFYIASGKTEAVSLNLDEDANHEFKISKISIALLQTIGGNVKVHACGTHGTPKIIVTQVGSEDKHEVPELNGVFDAATDVYLAAATDWTWKERTAPNVVTVDAKVNSLTNEGTLTVNATNVELSVAAATLANAAGATMNITKVTTVKNALTNLGTINVGSASNKTAELRAYGVAIDNDATALDACGVINNYGVVGVTDGTAGTFNNYGLIDMKDGEAITLLTTNEMGTKPFGSPFAAATNKMGTVVLPDGNPTAIVSVNNADANGFIKYTWPATTSTYETPAGNVKYNTIVVSGNIEFTETEAEIQFIEFNGTRTQVVNPGGLLTKLKGIIVNPGKSIILEKGNRLAPKVGAFLGEGATIYNGGDLDLPAGATTNYFGTWSTDQIVKY